MSQLRVLHIEDNPLDAELIAAILSEEGISSSIQRVQTREEFLSRLEGEDFDLILADYSLPSFDGMTALAEVTTKRPDLPFIFVTGTMGEEAAINALTQGAKDYIFKHRLGRLVPAVRRVIADAQAVAAHKEGQEALRRAEEQLQQAQKMELVGQLAGGIAHDFNNLLTVINGYSEMLLADSPPGDPSRESLNEIRSAGERAAALTQQLLAFSRKQMVQPAVLNLNKIVTEIEKMLRRLIGENIKFVTRLAPDLGNARVDVGQIQQVIMNLAVNSRDAMPRGGSLIIETANATFDEAYAAAHPGARAGAFVMLGVTDTGIGMTAEVKERLFEPFFTTKPKGSGTGLGLATVYGMVQQSDGWTWVYSEENRGTAFKIYFPRTDAPLAETNHKPKTDLRGNETILVVEDEPGVRHLAIEALQRYGYAVISAASGSEALSLAQEFPDRIDLLLTDVVMPGLNGRELASQLREVRPQMRVLYMCGYTDNAIVHSGTLEPGLVLLQKPFTPESLAERVRDVLTAPLSIATLDG